MGQGDCRNLRAAASGLPVGAVRCGGVSRPVDAHVGLTSWVVFVVTAYSWECGALPHGITKSGRPAVPEWTVAADPRVIPLGALIELEGVHPHGRQFWRVEDVGGAIKGHRLDIFLGTCQAARSWGKRKVRVRVWQGSEVRSKARGAEHRGSATRHRD